MEEGEEPKMKGGWTTRMSPRTMKRQREMERIVRGLLRMILSRKTLKTGEVKLMTMRSPIGIIRIAATQPKLIVDIVKPYRTIRK